MDPTQCFRDLLRAITEDDQDLIFELVDALNAWLNKGGFYPEGFSKDYVNETLIEYQL